MIPQSVGQIILEVINMAAYVFDITRDQQVYWNPVFWMKTQRNGLLNHTYTGPINMETLKTEIFGS